MPYICPIPKEETFDLPEGCYRARLTSVRPHTKQQGNSQIHLVRLLFEVEIPSLKNRIPMAGRNFVLDLKRGSDLRGCLEAWNSELFAVDADEFDFDQLVGREVDIVLRHHQSGRHPRPYVNIDQIHPAGTLELTESNQLTATQFREAA